MTKQTFSVQGQSRERLDRYLLRSLPEGFSRSRLHRLFDEGRVWVNGQKAKPHHRVAEGERIELEIVPAPEPAALLPEPISLKIVYEDPFLVVVDKPAGMVVHPAAGNWSGTLVNALLYHVKTLSSNSGPLRPGIVHRLDKETSGLLVCAKEEGVHTELSRQFEKREVKRTYLALVKGVVQFDQGKVALPLGRSRADRKKMSVRYLDGKEAVTHYEVIQRFKEFTFLRLKLDTGRTHQIRVHLAFLGHPVLGDRTYGKSHGLPRQALHAATLGFVHPVQKTFLSFESPLPEEMKTLIERGEIP